jgi:2-polyprenyl-6-methoxyphenol hydroxylase-like FAD-dependent oxidoreductase
MSDADVLIAGADPIGLTAAIELSRHGVACRIVDPLLEPRQYAKAVGVQPRTPEVFEGMGVLRRILDELIRAELPDTILVSVSHRGTVHQYHRRHLELIGGGHWRLGRLAVPL